MNKECRQEMRLVWTSVVAVEMGKSGWIHSMFWTEAPWTCQGTTVGAEIAQRGCGNSRTATLPKESFCSLSPGWGWCGRCKGKEKGTLFRGSPLSPKANALGHWGVFPEQTLLWERWEGPVERENQRPRPKCQQPPTHPTWISALGKESSLSPS